MHKFLLYDFKFALQEPVSLQIELVLIVPHPLFFLQVVGLQARVFDIGATVSHNVEQAQDEASLADSVCHWLNQIPTEPGDIEDAVVAHEELESEKACHACDLQSVTSPFCRLNLIFMFLQLLELSIGDSMKSAQLENLFVHDCIFKELGLMNVFVAYILNSDLCALCTCLFS